jgi:hypothetical protein
MLDCCRILPSYSMKLLARCRIVLQQLTRFKLRTVLVGKAIHRVDVSRDANLVQVAERATTEGCKACSKDKPNVSDDGIINDTIFQTFRGLVHKSIKSANEQCEQTWSSPYTPYAIIHTSLILPQHIFLTLTRYDPEFPFLPT